MNFQFKLLRNFLGVKGHMFWSTIGEVPTTVTLRRPPTLTPGCQSLCSTERLRNKQSSRCWEPTVSKFLSIITSLDFSFYKDRQSQTHTTKKLPDFPRKRPSLRITKEGWGNGKRLCLASMRTWVQFPVWEGGVVLKMIKAKTIKQLEENIVEHLHGTDNKRKNGLLSCTSAVELV